MNFLLGNDSVGTVSVGTKALMKANVENNLESFLYFIAVKYLG